MPTLTKQIGTPKKGTSNVPMEIYQLIIDKIHEDTNCSASEKLRDLRSCSLVCRSFVSLCQRHIFAEALVGPGFNGGLDRNRLAIALQSNVGLANFVKRMVHLSDRDVKAENAPCLSVLLHLPRIQHLDIFCDNDQSPDFGRDTSDSYGASHFFKQYITSSTLTSVAIHGVKFLPLDVVLSAPNLGRLRLFLCGISPASSSPPAKSLRHLDLQHVSGVSLACFQPGMQLETLHLSAAPKSFLGPVSFSKVFPTLKNLKIQTVINIGSERVPRDERTKVMNHIFENALQLECLVVQANLIGQSAYMPLRIRECVFNSRASLKRLHLYYSFKTPAILWDSIYNVLSAVQSQNIMEEIDIIVFYDKIIGAPNTLRRTMSPILELWRQLDELLDEDIVRFPCLRKVYVKILIMETKEDHSLYDINREELNEFRQGVGRSFRWLLSNPEIEFVGRVGIHNYHSYTFPDICIF